MSNNKFDVQHFAKLARLKLDESQIPLLEEQMTNIVNMIQSLQELDLNDIEGSKLDILPKNVFQTATLEYAKNDEHIANFPLKEDESCKVPVIIEDND